MELFDKFSSRNESYTEKIKKDSKYIEGNKKSIINFGFKDICEIIIGENEIEYSTLEKYHKDNFTKKKKLEIASLVCKNDNYSRSFNVATIQRGFQNPNNLSSVLFLNEHYKINCIIYNSDVDKYYSTSLKDYPKLVCSRVNNNWIKETNDLPEDVKYSDYKELSNILNIDCDINIYKPFLGSISKYKMSDLEKMCKEMDISITKENGKKKLKKELYDNLNLKHLNLDI